MAKTGCSIKEGDGDKGPCDKSDEQDGKGRSENCQDDESASKDQNSDISHAEVNKVLNTCKSDKDGMGNNLKHNNDDGKDGNDEKSDSKDDSENYEDGVSANQVQNADTSNRRVVSKVNACTSEEKDNMIKDSINNINGAENDNDDDDEKDDEAVEDEEEGGFAWRRWLRSSSRALATVMESGVQGDRAVAQAALRAVERANEKQAMEWLVKALTVSNTVNGNCI